MAKGIQIIKLKEKEKIQLESMLRRGRWTARQLKRAQILLMAHNEKNLSNSTIASRLSAGRETVRLIRKRYQTYGVKSVLIDRPRSGQPRKIDKADGQFLLNLCRSPAPFSYERWTLVLLRNRLKRERGRVVSSETIRRYLLKHKKVKRKIKK